MSCRRPGRTRNRKEPRRSSDQCVPCGVSRGRLRRRRLAAARECRRECRRSSGTEIHQPRVEVQTCGFQPPAPGAWAESPLERSGTPPSAAPRGRSTRGRRRSGRSTPRHDVPRQPSRSRSRSASALCRHGERRHPRPRSRRGSARPSGGRAGSSDRRGRARVATNGAGPALERRPPTIATVASEADDGGDEQDQRRDERASGRGHAKNAHGVPWADLRGCRSP